MKKKLISPLPRGGRRISRSAFLSLSRRASRHYVLFCMSSRGTHTNIILQLWVHGATVREFVLYWGGVFWGPSTFWPEASSSSQAMWYGQ